MLRRGAAYGAPLTSRAVGGQYNHPAASPFLGFGCRSLRVWGPTAQWRQIESTQGVRDPTGTDGLDDQLAFAAAHGLDVLYTIGGCPDWATLNAGSGNYNANPPSSTSDITAFLSWLVPRMPAGSAYEAWNEPNSSTFWNGTAAALSAQHIACYDTIKAIDPTAVFLSACPQGVNAWRYLASYLTPEVLAKTDAVAIHAYVTPSPPEKMVSEYYPLRGWLNANGGASLPIWNTEFTWHDFASAGVAVSGPASSAVTLASDPSCMPQVLAAAYAARSMIVGAALFERNYPYWTDQWWSSLRTVTDLADPTTLTDAGMAAAYIATILGSRPKLEQAAPLWKAKFFTPDGNLVTAYWCDDDKTVSVDLSGYVSGFDVLGTPVMLSSSYSLTHSPVFCLN